MRLLRPQLILGLYDYSGVWSQPYVDDDYDVVRVEYGDPYTKLTCLWGSFNPPVRNLVEATEGSKMHYVGPSPERAQIRSQTPAGFAQAFFEANP